MGVRSRKVRALRISPEPSPAAANCRCICLARLTLHASLHSAQVGERSMLIEALDRLGSDDVLVLDRGYPATWPVALLTARQKWLSFRSASTP